MFVVVPVTYDQELAIIEAGGVQIIDLTTIAAPRNTKYKTSLLQNYEFVPYERVVSTEYPKSLLHSVPPQTCFSEPKEISAKPLNNLSSVSTLSNGFSESANHSVSRQLASLQPIPTQVSDSHWMEKALETMCSPMYLKPALEIVFENFVTRRLLLTELVYSDDCSFYGKVLSSFEGVPMAIPQLTLWLAPSVNRQQHDEEDCSIIQSKHDAENLSVSSQHLVILSYFPEVSYLYVAYIGHNE